MNRVEKVLRRAADGALLLVLLVFASGCSAPLVVEEVLSGDEVRLSDGRTVRYAGIDAPDPGEPMYETSRGANADLVSGKVVQLVEGASSDEAYVYTPIRNGDLVQYLFVNRELVLFGYAQVSEPQAMARPDLLESLREAQEIARSEDLGIWAKSE